MNKKKQIWVSEEYAKQLKSDAAQAGKTLIRYTGEIAKSKKKGPKATFNDYLGL